MWLFFCFIWLTLTAPVWAQSQPPAARKLLTLEEAVNTALQDNRQVKNATLEVSKSEHLLAATRTHRWPKVGVLVAESWLLTPQENFNALGSLPGQLPIPTPVSNPSNLFPSRQPTAFLTGLMAQPLTQQYRIGLNISLHGVMRDIAQEELRAKRQTVVDDVKRPTSIFSRHRVPWRASKRTSGFCGNWTGCPGRYFKEKTVLKSETPGGPGQTGPGGAESDSAA